MTNMTTARLVTALGAALALAGGAHAQDFTPKHKGLVMLNIRVTDVAPDAGDPIKTAAGAATGLHADVKEDVMPTVGIAYFLTDHVAVDLTLGSTKHIVKAVGPGVNVAVHETWVLPPVVALQYHFAPQARLSPYVGAGLNYMLFYSGKDKNGFKVKLKDGVGYALQAGVDYALKDRWSANLDVKKVFFDTRATINGGALTSNVKLDPWVVSAGLGYKF
jgi:outer membrane protein